MEARNLPSCVKCPDLQMLALFSILNILQTKQNASWLPVCDLCAASDLANSATRWNMKQSSGWHGRGQRSEEERNRGLIAKGPRTQAQHSQDCSFHAKGHRLGSHFSSQGQGISHAGLEPPGHGVLILYKTLRKKVTLP